MKKFVLITILIFARFQTQAQLTEEGRYIGLELGYGMLSSDLSGSGFNSNFPMKGGMLYGLDLAYQNAKGPIQYNFKYLQNSIDQTAPSGVTPTNISVFRQDLRFIASMAPWDFGRLENLRLGFGIGILQTGATDTSPYNVLTQQSTQGFLLEASYKTILKSKWPLISDFLIYLPYQIKESPQITGYNPSYMGFELKFSTEYSFSNMIIGFVGFMYRMDKVSFDGTVNRGVTGGQDTRSQMAIPVGIKIGY